MNKDNLDKKKLCEKKTIVEEILESNGDRNDQSPHKIDSVMFFLCQMFREKNKDNIIPECKRTFNVLESIIQHRIMKRHWYQENKNIHPKSYDVLNYSPHRYHHFLVVGFMLLISSDDYSRKFIEKDISIHGKEQYLMTPLKLLILEFNRCFTIYIEKIISNRMKSEESIICLYQSIQMFWEITKRDRLIHLELKNVSNLDQHRKNIIKKCHENSPLLVSNGIIPRNFKKRKVL